MNTVQRMRRQLEAVQEMLEACEGGEVGLLKDERVCAADLEVLLDTLVDIAELVEDAAGGKRLSRFTESDIRSLAGLWMEGDDSDA